VANLFKTLHISFFVEIGQVL